jgi:hypothetical protein
VRICLIAVNDATRDPRARVARHLLAEGGHEVLVVSSGAGHDDPKVIPVRLRASTIAGRMMWRMLPAARRRARADERLASAATATGAHLFIPTDARAMGPALEAARRTEGAVARTPRLPPVPDHDLIRLAPSRPELAAPVAGLGSNHTPSDSRRPYRPEPGRHKGRRVVLCYRRTDINPGKYLEAALVRGGAEVRVETDRIDLSTVPGDTAAVVFVEGPYPALEVTGDTPVPILFWAHHGEHHLHANLRLTDRYRADAVLLAHSWHLAHWFPTTVHRFPFGMATELLDPSMPLAQRQRDVAMVGAKIRGGGPYDRRQQIVAALETLLPQERLGFAEQISAEEMADLYANSKIIVNEGGIRHYPITMRVLEAVGSGAVLLSDEIPGMEVLLSPGEQFEIMGDDVVADVKRILADPMGMQRMASSALERARGLHTYDHRVDELLGIAATTTKRPLLNRREQSTLGAVIDRDVEVQRVAQVGAPDLADDLPSREVWDADQLSPERLAPKKMEAIAIRADDVTPLRPVLRAARRYVYVEGEASGLGAYLSEEEPQAVLEQHHGIQRVDLMAASYRVMPFEVVDR